MGVLQALRRTPGALARAPGLLVPQLLVFVLLLPQLLLQSTYPTASVLLSLGSSAVLLVGMPFVQGGMLGMADEALTTRSSLSRFVAEGKANYLRLLAAYVVLLVVNGVLGAIGFAAGVGAFVTHDAVRMAFVALAAVAGLTYLVVAFFVQFYGQAIVVDGTTVIASFKRSYRVVRANLLATVGYVLLALVIGALSGGVYAGVSVLASPEAAATYGLPALSTPLLVGVGLLAAVLGSVASAFMLTFSVAVYDELAD
ncbi:hypothetical protein [Haloplanus halophilus]|uniref:DUF7847 domain-containing protein n=1 Tax=Haloplanus halophilus TaxID=2949993 RepID=UPI00203BF064|nr:hypothetical protein [Haloplanus sp. GDY1]